MARVGRFRSALRLAPVRARTLTAAGKEVNSAAGRGESGASPKQDWQRAVMDLYHALGELWYGAQFYARAFSKLILLTGVIDPTTGEFTPSKSGPGVDALTRLQEPGGGRSRMLAKMGRLWFLVGEFYLTCTFLEKGEDADDSPDGERWEVLSKSELEVGDGVYKRRTRPNGPVKEYQQAKDGAKTPNTMLVFRIWRDDPEWSELADAPTRAVLEVCEELRLAGRASRAASRSRIATAGMLTLPDELSLPIASDVDSDATDEDPESDPFVDELVRTMSEAIRDESSAAAMVPVIIRGAKDFLDGVRKIDLSPETEANDKRMELIRRIALGLDMPPEVLLGVMDANHWTAWSVSEDAWKGHLQPAVEELMGNLTSSFLRSLSVPAPEVMWYDPSRVVEKPDRGKDAMDAHDRLVISDEALREAKGFEDSDKPDDDEYNRRIGIKLGDIGVALGGDSEAPGGEGDAPAGPETVEEGDDPSAAPEAPPEQEQDTALAIALALTIERARERAGSRLRTRLQRRPSLAREYEQTPNRLLAAALGEAMVSHLGTSSDELVSGDYSGAVEGLVACGYSRTRACLLVETAKRDAALTLFDLTKRDILRA